MGMGERRMEIGNGESGMEWSYGPGMGLKGPASFGEAGERREGGGGGQERDEVSTPPHKRVCLGPRPHPHGGGVVQVPSHLIQRHSGGRGFTRFRSKRALEGNQ